MNGITIDIPYLDKLSKELKNTLEDIESKVYELAEENFNLSSPKQLGEILFEKLNLEKKKRHFKILNLTGKYFLITDLILKA